jgi:prevent-host-death family protein
MKKRKTFNYPPARAEAMALNESAPALEEAEMVVNVRAAKDQLSSLLEQAARGNEVIITSDGLPKAKLVPVRARRQPFRVNWDLLRSMPLVTTGPTTEQLVREDRDGRT